MPSDLVVTDEQAKAAQEIAKTAGTAVEALVSLGGYFAEVLGDAPKDMVGWLVGDRLKTRRARNAEQVARKTKEILDEREVNERQETGFGLARDLIDAAADEDRSEMQGVWARLLAAAMDPARANSVRSVFIQIVKRMEPIDVQLFSLMAENDQFDNVRSKIQQVGDRRPNEITISIDHLRDLNLIQHSGNIWITSLGQELKLSIFS